MELTQEQKMVLTREQKLADISDAIAFAKRLSVDEAPIVLQRIEAWGNNPQLRFGGLTLTELGLQELYAFQEATGFDTADEYKASLNTDFSSWELGDWFQARTIEEMTAFYSYRLPFIRLAAKELGYGIGLHGSMIRDLDLIAIPWGKEYSTPTELAKAIQRAACGISCQTVTWEQKSAGRIATSLCICWVDHSNPVFKNMVGAGHIDLSVMCSGS